MSLIRFLYVILLVNVGVWAVELDCNGQSVLKKPIERIFSRKKRFLLLPTGASFKITVALGKAIISKVPRGLNLSIELSTYYPVPTVVEDWYIKKWKLKTTPRPKPKDTYIYIPGTNIRYPAKEATKRPPVFLRPQPLDPVPYAPAYKDKPFFSPWVSIFRRVDDKAYPLTDTVPKYNKFVNQSKWDNYGQKYSNKWSNPSSPYVNKFKQYENRGDYYRQKYSWDNQGSQSSKWYNSARNNASYWNPPRNSRVSENYYSNHEDAQDWKHYRGHRERRDIYNHFESFSSIIGFDVKMCILRTICESKRYLLPPGYSLIQDVIRIVFSMPTMDGMMDEYSHAMRSDDCVETFKKHCRFSLIDYVMNPNKK